MTGTVDFHDVLDALDEVSYAGNYNMELNLAWFGDRFLKETTEFAAKLMRYMLAEHYGAL